MPSTVKIALTLIVSSIACLPGALKAQDTARLRDGTVLSGELLRMSNDTLFFKTSFSDELPVERGQISSIDFGTGEGADGESQSPFIGSAPTGKLLLVITGPSLETSIRFRHSDDREVATFANRIIFQIMANGKVVYEKIDNTTDNEAQSEGWTILKNDFTTGRSEVPLPPGEYVMDVSIGNDLSNDYRKQFHSGEVALSRKKENVTVFEGGVTTLVLEIKKPFLNLGNYDMKWVE